MTEVGEDDTEAQREFVERAMDSMTDLAAPQQTYVDMIAAGGFVQPMDGLALSYSRANTEFVLRHHEQFSSDIDLLYLYETDQGAAGALSLHEFFAKLCERLTRAIADVGDDGFVFRVDLRLRPEGTRGPVCTSLGAAERYYESFGRPWERQAWVKARAVAPYDDAV